MRRHSAAVCRAIRAGWYIPPLRQDRSEVVETEVSRDNLYKKQTETENPISELEDFVTLSTEEGTAINLNGDKPIIEV